MPDPTTIILYVLDVPASARFYADLLGRQPVEAHANFAMLILTPGVMLGLWARHDVAPAAISLPGCAELAIAVADRETVLTLHQDWSRRGITIIQAPVPMDFGFTFTAADPDGHRLRVMALT